MAVKRGSFPTPALGPVRLELCGFVRIFQRLFVIFQRGIRAGPVRVEDMVGGFDLNGFAELLTSNTSVNGSSLEL